MILSGNNNKIFNKKYYFKIFVRNFDEVRSESKQQKSEYSKYYMIEVLPSRPHKFGPKQLINTGCPKKMCTHFK